MKKITKKKKEKYLTDGGGHCPFCGNEDIEGGPVEITQGGANQICGCHACDCEWYDLYTLTDVEAITRGG